ncbi:MAG: BON domain-containing protein [Deltaproteobacteria bacterium]|nr:BON domain-containing protein [Deltaproteobacteria bacterium]
MKKQVSLILVIILLAACSATPKKRSVGEVIDDSVISNKLKVKYLRDKTVKGLKINIDTWKGVVTLKGKVDSQGQIDRAVELAERQQGVREVKSYLIIRGPTKKTVVQGPVEEQAVTEAGEPPPAEAPAPAAEEKAPPQFDDEAGVDQQPKISD